VLELIKLKESSMKNRFIAAIAIVALASCAAAFLYLTEKGKDTRKA
jgi:hypothetical protein